MKLMDQWLGPSFSMIGWSVFVGPAVRSRDPAERDAQGRSRVIQWLMFQIAHIGPMIGQANVFSRYFTERIQPVIERYQREVPRLFGVLDGQLATHEYTAADYSIADIPLWPWVSGHDYSGISVDEFKSLQRGWRWSLHGRRCRRAAMCRSSATARRRSSRRGRPARRCWSEGAAA